MKQLLIFSLLFISILSCGLSRDTDIVNAYEFKFGNTLLFNDFDTFIAEMGLPDSFMTFNDTLYIKSKEELDLAIKNEIESGRQMLDLHYPGLVMECFPDKRIVPGKIDFRKTNKSVQFKQTLFDRNFTEKEFGKLFPFSALTAISGELFCMVTNENIPDLTHYMVLRKSVDVPKYLEMEEGPVIIFTFQKGKLIYMYFANF